MPQLDQEPFLPHFNDDDQLYLRRFDNRCKRYAIPSYLWNIAINETSELRFLARMEDDNVPRRVWATEVTEPMPVDPIPNFDLALLTAEC